MKFLREKLEKLGCEMPRQSFACRPCEGMDISGGFVPPTKDAKGNLSPAEVRRGAAWCGAVGVGVRCGVVGPCCARCGRSPIAVAYPQL